MELQQNRYSATVPTCINDLGTSISTPFYISPTADQKKTLLNAFRVIKQKQLIEAGFKTERTEGSLVVVDYKQPPQAPIEVELGITEDNLRLMLFSRQGIQERLIIKLQELTGVKVFSKAEVLETFTHWLNHLLPDDENTRTQKTTKAPVRRTKRTKVETSPSA